MFSISGQKSKISKITKRSLWSEAVVLFQGSNFLDSCLKTNPYPCLFPILLEQKVTQF